MRFIARVGDRRIALDLEEDGHRRQASIAGQPYTVEWNAAGVGQVLDTQTDLAAHYGLLADGQSRDIYVRPVEAADDESAEAQAFEVIVRGRTFRVVVRDERSEVLSSLAREGHVSGEIAVRAPMPGMVSHVLVAEGAAVERGQAVVVLEAMKMENDLAAPRSGVVVSLRAEPGQTVHQGDVLVVVGDPVAAAPPAGDADNYGDE